MRKFEEVKKELQKFPDVETSLPERSDAKSAGYDFKSKENYVLQPGETHFFWTDIKSRFYFDNTLQIYPRSGISTRKKVKLANSVGVIDPSYCDNPENDGNIGIPLVNEGNEPFEVKIGDRIAQGVFVRYLITDDDKYVGNFEGPARTGGFGSTGR